MNHVGGRWNNIYSSKLDTFIQKCSNTISRFGSILTISSTLKLGIYLWNFPLYCFWAINCPKKNRRNPPINHIINNDNFFIFINNIIIESLLIAISWSSKLSYTWSYNNLYILSTIMPHLLTSTFIRMKSMKRGMKIFITLNT